MNWIVYALEIILAGFFGWLIPTILHHIEKTRRKRTMNEFDYDYKANDEPLVVCDDCGYGYDDLYEYDGKLFCADCLVKAIVKDGVAEHKTYEQICAESELAYVWYD